MSKRKVSVQLTDRVVLDFSFIKNELYNRWGKTPSNFDVVVELIRIYKERKVIVSKMESLKMKLNNRIEKLENKLKEKDEQIIELLRDAINRPININVGALAQNQMVQNTFVPPKPVKEIKGLKKQKKELLNEIKTKFVPENCREDGLLLPSKIRDDEEILEVKEEIQKEIKEKKENEKILLKANPGTHEEVEKQLYRGDL
ncbi:MAG: hypothetical protein ACTSQ8_08115 [Candidatus Helarchaeota archaeon]